MRIIHRFSLSLTLDVKEQLQKYGVVAREGFCTIPIDEAHPYWNNISELLLRHRATDIIHTTFTKRECSRSTWLSVSPSWHYGYPQPEDEFKYLKETYDLSLYCEVCGIGAVQRNPFQIRKEPVWGKNSILQLNWIFDEYFVKKDLYEQVFEPLNIGMWPVLRYSSGEELGDVVQLKVEEISDRSLAIHDHSSEECTACTRRKISPHTRGMFPPFQEAPQSGVAMFKTKEIWGSGAVAYREIIASNECYKAIKDANVRGIEFRPLQES